MVFLLVSFQTQKRGNLQKDALILWMDKIHVAPYMVNQPIFRILSIHSIGMCRKIGEPRHSIPPPPKKKKARQGEALAALQWRLETKVLLHACVRARARATVLVRAHACVSAEVLAQWWLEPWHFQPTAVPLSCLLCLAWRCFALPAGLISCSRMPARLLDCLPACLLAPSFDPSVHPFIHSSSHLFNQSFLPSLPPSVLHSFLPSFLPSFIPSFIPSFLHSFLPSFLHSFLPSFISSFLPSFIHSVISSLSHSITHLFSQLCMHKLTITLSGSVERTGGGGGLGDILSSPLPLSLQLRNGRALKIPFKLAARIAFLMASFCKMQRLRPGSSAPPAWRLGRPPASSPSCGSRGTCDSRQGKSCTPL